MSKVKTCSYCNISKPVTDFNKRVRSLDGLQSRCRDCNKEYAKEYNVKYLPNRRNGDAENTGSRLYNIWSGMLDRCINPENPDYPNYGGRGIQVCQEWLTWSGFKEDMLNTYQADLSIERMDVNGDYSPSNCKWIPLNEQSWNKRNSVVITSPDGDKIFLAEYCAKNNLELSTLYARFQLHGDDYDKVIAPKIVPKKRHPKDVVRLIAFNIECSIQEAVDNIKRDTGYELPYLYVNQVRSDWRKDKDSSVLKKIVGSYKTFTGE